ncbi:tyrosine-type recombinase/integrase [Flavobacterium sp. HNIBRBA15423]|uniref:tyrosine-type recombinase/integrase n=1 Tax=Flavobacterium sp. HNIBRBA15423 TaxID=3458683 RepID=UPI00404461BE
MKLKEIIPAFIEYKSAFVKRSTISAYSLLLQNHVLPFFGELEEFEEDLVQDYVLKKSKNGLSNKTISDTLIVLKMVLKFGSKRKLYNNIDYGDIVYPLEQKKGGFETLSIAQTNLLINHTKKNFTFRNLGILLCISTGIRIGEVCALQWKDFDLEKGIVTVNKTIQRIYIVQEGKRKTELIIDDPKTANSNRQIPLSPDLLFLIKPLMKIVSSENFILTNEEKPTEPRTYRAYYHSYMRKLDLPIMKFHGLRHTFATRCINAGVDIKTTSVMLGHSNITTTLNLYSHPDLAQKKTAIGKMFKSLK